MVLTELRSTVSGGSFWGRLAIIVLAFCVQTWDARGQDKLIQVCVTDASNQAGLANASVQLTADQLTLTGLTGRGGCVYLEGVFPVSSESETPLQSVMESGSPYPNPASDRVVIPVHGARGIDTFFELFDVQGRRIPVRYTRALQQTTLVYEVELDGLADGVYFYRVSDAAGQATGKFIRSAGTSISTSNASPASSSGFTDNLHILADSVTIEVSKNGFETVTLERMLSNFETVPVSLFKVTNDLIPLIDMFGVKYLGLYSGGLYPNQQNQMPGEHYEAGVERAVSIEPLDLEGNPAANGRIVMTSVGMSTTSSIFCGVADPNDPCKEGTFMNVLEEDDALNARLTIIDGADPGKTADKWETPDANAFDRVRDEELVPFGMSEAQVQVAWVNLASSTPSTTLPNEQADALTLKRQYGNVLRSLATRYPNLKMVFFASRVYAGYATTELNPEPFAYEAGFAVKWTIEAQVLQMHENAPADQDAGNLNFNNRAPWIAWGPYLWADGQNPRSDGLIWLPEDLKEDGTHLNRPGIEKVTAILIDFFKTNGLTRCWFLENGPTCG